MLEYFAKLIPVFGLTYLGAYPPHTHTRTCTHIHTYKHISEGNTIFRGIMLWMKAFAWLGCCHDLDTVDGDTFAIEQQYVM